MDSVSIVTPRQVGICVRRARKAQGLTRAQLAAASGVSVRSLASLEAGDAPGIRLDKMLAIYHALGLSLITQGEDITQDDDVKAPRAAAVGRRSRVAAVKGACSRSVRIQRPSTPQVSASYDEALRNFIADNIGVTTADDAGRINSMGQR